MFDPIATKRNRLERVREYSKHEKAEDFYVVTGEYKPSPLPDLHKLEIVDDYGNYEEC